jgi:photosystem II stability/assembly factor-like uncharacterized protein
MMKRILNRFASIFYTLSMLLFIIAFNFSDNPVGNWYQQFMPNIGGRSIKDITFIDSLTGYAVTSTLSDTSFILKTSNGGDNWSIIRADSGFTFNRVQFINQNTGFVGGLKIVGSSFRNFLKTTDQGASWSVINGPTDTYVSDMSVLSEDTIFFACDFNFATGGVYRTTNGGTSWQSQLNLGSSNPDHIYMFNGRIGFICETNNYIRKTYDGGQNWSIILNGQSFRDMYFIDSLTGWRAYGNNMYKTTNGGLNWVTQILPYGGNIITTGIYKFSNVNADTIWGSGGWVQYPNFEDRGMIYRTTNGGNNWLYQVPDTSIHIFQYYHNKFVNKNNGWAYATVTGVHTTNGGDPIFYTPINQISSNIPKEFKLGQNYPNPFNPGTKFKILITSNVRRQTSDVKIKVYSITGREISIILDQRLAPGEYEINFDAKELSSGVYFYSLFVEGSLIDTKKMMLIK